MTNDDPKKRGVPKVFWYAYPIGFTVIVVIVRPTLSFFGYSAWFVNTITIACVGMGCFLFVYGAILKTPPP